MIGFTSCGMYPTWASWPQVILPASGSSSPISVRSSVVLPTPLRPTTATFSPLVTRAEKPSNSVRSNPLVRPSMVSVCLPLGRFCSNLMNGRAMFDFFRSVTDLLQLLDAALYLGSAGAGREARDELLQ